MTGFFILLILFIPVNCNCISPVRGFWVKPCIMHPPKSVSFPRKRIYNMGYREDMK